MIKKGTYSNQKSTKKRTVATDNFLEALRNLGANVADSMVDDVAGGITREAINQVTGNQKSGDLKPNQPLDFDQLPWQEEARKERLFRQDFTDLARQEKLIWARQEQETKMQISAILQELKKLAQSVKNLDKQVEVAAQEVPVDPGIYHINFFEKLRQAIVLFRKRIEESANWLAVFNQRAKKRNFYWQQFRKSGTKFLLSQERYMATQAG